jgi:hypothetical protein
MQPLDRDNEQFRDDATTMRAATLLQRSQNDEQRTRARALKEKHDALMGRLRLVRKPVDEPLQTPTWTNG